MLDDVCAQAAALAAELPLIVAGDLNTLPRWARYLPVVGATDLRCSFASEPALLRAHAAALGLHDPFALNATTALGCKLDWVLATAALRPLRWRRQERRSASDHRWLMVEYAQIINRA